MRVPVSSPVVTLATRSAPVLAVGVSHGQPRRAGNAIIADVLAQYPRRFIGLATISPHDGGSTKASEVPSSGDQTLNSERLKTLYGSAQSSPDERTRSSAMAGNVAALPSAERLSKTTFWPSI